LGEDCSNKMFLNEIPISSDKGETVHLKCDSETDHVLEVLMTTPASDSKCDSDDEPESLASFQQKIEEKEIELRSTLLKLRQAAKHPIERWLDGYTSTGDLSSFAASFKSTDSFREELLSTAGCSTIFSRPSSVILSDRSPSPVEDDEELDEKSHFVLDAAPDQSTNAASRTSERIFNNVFMEKCFTPGSSVSMKLCTNINSSSGSSAACANPDNVSKTGESSLPEEDRPQAD